MTLSPAVRRDLAYGEGVIAQAVTSSSWDRNASWISKFATYVANNCKDQLKRYGAQWAMTSDTISTAFLAKVVREDPEAHTRVVAAKRAINLLRAFADCPSLDTNPAVKFLTRGARNAIVKTTRQSPALLAVFIAAIIVKWGSSTIWWQRQTALMILLSFCALARGSGITSCLRKGLSWVRKDGSIRNNASAFELIQHCQNSSCSHPQCVRGFLLLFPARKNHRNSPSWIPIAEKAAIRMMVRHVNWLRSLPAGTYLFPARKRSKKASKSDPISFAPNTDRSSRMSTKSFRFLLRVALVECCGLSERQSRYYGTHSPRIGTVEELRKCGVSSEMRQQLGAWMSKSVALSYMQLSPSAQFDILRTMANV